MIDQSINADKKPLENVGDDRDEYKQTYIFLFFLLLEYLEKNIVNGTAAGMNKYILHLGS